MKGEKHCLALWLLVVMFTFVEGAARESNRRDLYIEESRHRVEPNKDYIDEEFDIRPGMENKELENKNGTKRHRRQAGTTEEPEGSGGTQEPLLVEDPPGIGL